MSPKIITSLRSELMIKILGRCSQNFIGIGNMKKFGKGYNIYRNLIGKFLIN